MTKKKLVLLIAFLLILFICLLYKFNYISHKKYSNEYFDIDTYISSIDKDNDGIDDQSDILIKSLNIKVNIMLQDILMMNMEYVVMLLLLPYLMLDII